MNRISFFLVTAWCGGMLASASPAATNDPRAKLYERVKELFSAKCGGCHSKDAKQEEGPHFVDDLSALNDPDYINRDRPEDSKLYSLLVTGKMPRTTREEKAAGKKATPLTPDETQMVLEWLKAEAPVAVPTEPARRTTLLLTIFRRTNRVTPIEPIPTTDESPAPTPQQPAAADVPQSPTPAPAQSPLPAKRTIVSEAEMLAGALQDLLSQPEEVRSDVRYLSIHPQHNNLDEIDDVDAWLARCGIRKLLNSLSSNPKVAQFEKTGPESVLHRVRLRDIGWTAEMWDSVTASYPYALDAGALAALAAPTRCAVPVVRADWFAANASRPPLYDRLLHHPDHARELERKLGVDIAANLASGDAMRSGFTQSGVSKQNRLVERHEIKAYAGYYWKSYDFQQNDRRARLADHPLGPPEANLFGGAFAFDHAGGEIVYSLPNGFQAYLLTDAKGTKIDIGPIEIVSDRFDKTGRAQIINGFSCIACHDRGMKELPADEIRAVAGGAAFGAEAQRLIERLHPEQEKINATVKADALAFQKAVAVADVDPAAKREPVLALVEFYENDVTLAQAAAEIGMKREAFEKALNANAALFDIRIALRGPGIPRVVFDGHFSELAERFGLGRPRIATAVPAFRANVDPPGERALAVSLKADKRRYREGDRMLFTVETNHDAFVRLIYQDAEGNVKVLLPNVAHNGKLKGRIPVTFGDGTQVDPATGRVLQIRCSPPFGNEVIAAVASDTAFTNDKEVIAAAKVNGGLANGRKKGAELELVESVRARAQDKRVGVAREFLQTTR